MLTKRFGFLAITLAALLNSCSYTILYHEPVYHPVSSPEEISSVPGAYFPTTIGTRWTYAISHYSYPHNDTVNVAIVDSAIIHDSESATKWVYTYPTHDETFFVVVKDGMANFFRWTDNSLVKARSHKIPPLGRNMLGDYSSQVLDSLSTPAGVFKRVYHLSYNPPPGRNSVDYWFAPGVGMTRMSKDLSPRTYGKPQNSPAGRVDEVWQLIGYSVK
jgi:hypothetical protein